MTFDCIFIVFLLLGLGWQTRSNIQVGLAKNFSLNNTIIQTSHQTNLPVKQFCKKNLFENRSICGIGIISLHNKKCIQWSLSKYNNDNLVENTTFCKKSKYKPYYCATAYDKWDLCQPIECRSSNTEDLCNDNITIISLTTSIGIDFSHTVSHTGYGILIMSYSTTNSCLIAKMCSQCSSTDEMIVKHFHSCQFVNKEKNDSRLIMFKNITQNSVRIFYLIPVFTGHSIGSVVQLSIRTKMSAPGSPVDVSIVNKTSTTIFINWNQATEEMIYGNTDSYDIDVMNQPESHNRASYDTWRNDFMILNLIPCTTYCITITAVNIAGKSAPSKIICSRTNPVFYDVKLLPVQNDSVSQRLVAWNYNDPFRCPIIFRLEYFVVGRVDKSYYITNNHNIYLVDLEMNRIYIVAVRPELDGELGLFSSPITFQTGQADPSAKKISINCANLSCEISWEIVGPRRPDTVSWILLLKNNENKCVHIIRYNIEINITFDQSESQIKSLINNSRSGLVNETQACLQETIQYCIGNYSKFKSHMQTIGKIKHGIILIYSSTSTGIDEIGRKYFNITDGNSTSCLVLVVSLFMCICLGCILAWFVVRKRHLSIFKRTSLRENTIACTERNLYFSGPHMLQSSYRYSENYPSEQTFQYRFNQIQVKIDLMKQHKIWTTAEKLRYMNEMTNMLDSISPTIKYDT